ncbi:aquaporin [Bifidobacterium aemilianum]|uniref:Aquaporin n=1 Tax=Bifidobacterium aemilianum TaxID=2493120 RepID=A0A366K6J7_9BIFI|nr:MIP/aquaporin family protein [Bifidobacterium aemilianum]RBP97370.1 aquaporin [Bifidobacterium aemilianum]
MEYALMTKLAAEFVGTAILMVFGNGAVANVELKGTKGFHSGWLTIAMGYGFGVMFPVLMFGAISGAQINPAMTIAQAVNGMFPWNQVLPFIVAQLLGAAVGQLLVYAAYYPHYRQTESPEAILASFTTTDASDSNSNYFINEFIGTLILVLGALCCLEGDWGSKNKASAAIVVGFIVWGLVTSLGGPTGPGLNPARDLVPRILHQLLPIAHKGSSRWGEAWIPVVAPIMGAIGGAFIFKQLFA